jgi:hypothetical membrane protein
MRMLSLGGALGPLVFAAAVLIAAALRPDYSHVTHFISELGANGTTNAALMNYAGFVPGGLMLAAFGVALAGALPRRRLTLAAAALVTLFGGGVAASGFISCDAGCPQGDGSIENAIHNAIAPIAFLCLIAATAVLGLCFRRLPGWRAFSLYSLLTSAFALGFLAALAGSLDTRELTGLWQRLLLAVLFLWCAVVGIQAFRATRRSHGSD